MVSKLVLMAVRSWFGIMTVLFNVVILILLKFGWVINMYDLRLENKKLVNTLFCVNDLCDYLTAADDSKNDLAACWRSGDLNDRDYNKYAAINREFMALCEARIVDLGLYEIYKNYVTSGDRWALVGWLDTLADGLEDRLLVIIEQIKAIK